MRTMFDIGLRKTLGQSSYGWNNPYGPWVPYTPTQQTPSAVPAVPPPPAIPAEVRRPIDAATRSKLQGIISAVKEIRDKVAAWWDEQGPEKARQILGKRFPEYQQYLTGSMSYDSLAETLQGRLSAPGSAIVDSEIQGMENYAKVTQDLYDLVFGKLGDPGIATDSKKELVAPGLVAVGAFITAILI